MKLIRNTSPLAVIPTAVVFSVIMLFAVVLLNAPQAAAQPVQKKLIETGWDIPTAANLRKNLAQMEQTPFDGVLVRATGTDDTGKEVTLGRAFSDIPIKKEWFQSAIDDLQAVQSSKLTDNFVHIGANPGSVDWFDDAAWKEVVNHFRIATEVAKEGHQKGILFDPEPYTKPYRAFSYVMQPQADKYNFAEYEAKARQRGQEVMKAIAAVYPDLTIFTYFMNSVNERAAKSSNPEMAIQGSTYALYPAFINGWLDMAPPTITFVDGIEQRGYRANSELDFLQAANTMRNTTRNLVAPENWQKYGAQVQTSFGIYLDAYTNPPTSSWYIDPMGISPAERLGVNLEYAVNAATEYVWIYGEKYRWWETPNTRVNQESWEEIFPGVSAALLNATHPHLAVTQIFADLEKGSPKNLLQNGNFSQFDTNAKPLRNDSSDWESVGAPTHWSTWQDEHPSGETLGKFFHDDKVNRAGSEGGAARISNMYNGCFIQGVAVKPGEKYAIRAWLRQKGNGIAHITARWKDSQKHWTQEVADVSTYAPADTQKGDWRRIDSVVTVPEGASELVLLLLVNGQTSEQDVVWFDNVQIYQVN